MPNIAKELRPLVPAIQAILEEHQLEKDAAPKLRALAIKHAVRRYKVFAAYRLLAQQRKAAHE